MDRNRTIW